MIANPSPDSAPAAAFQQTRWSLVGAARAGDDALGALTVLCRDYAYPVYAYVRRSGHAPEAAHAVCRAFFARLAHALREVDPRAHGRFRTFLLAQLTQFLATDWSDAPPDDAPLPDLPLAQLEARHRHEAARAATPAQGFERGFALELLVRGMRQLRNEAAQGGRLELFERLEPYLSREPGPGEHALIERDTGLRPLVSVVAIRRLRQRFRELIDAELSQTVASDKDLEAERDTLLSILGGDR